MPNLVLHPTELSEFFCFSVDRVMFQRSMTFKQNLNIEEMSLGPGRPVDLHGMGLNPDKPFRLCFSKPKHISCQASITTELAESMLAAGAVLTRQVANSIYRQEVDCVLPVRGFRCKLDSVFIYSDRRVPDPSVLSIRSAAGRHPFLLTFGDAELTTCTTDLTEKDAEVLFACGAQLVPGEN